MQIQDYRDRTRGANADSSLVPGSFGDGSAFLVLDVYSSFSGKLHLVSINSSADVSIPLILYNSSLDPTSFHK